MIRYRRLLLALVVVAAGFGLYSLWTRPVRITLTEGEIQAALDRQFPLTKRYLFLLDVTYSHPHVRLDPVTNRIRMGVDAAASLPFSKRRYTGTAELSGGLSYEPDRGTLFLTDGRLERLAIDGLPGEYRDQLTEIATGLVSVEMGRIPIYRLRPGDIRHDLAKLTLRDVRVQRGRVLLVMGIGKN